MDDGAFMALNGDQNRQKGAFIALFGDQSSV